MRRNFPGRQTSLIDSGPVHLFAGTVARQDSSCRR
jgi:hypothetical protein